MKTDIPSTAEEHALASRVVRTFHENIVHRRTSGTDNVLVSALAAWSRLPPEEDVRLFQSMGVLPKTYDSLTRVKLVQIMAVLNRVFGQVGDKSWGCSASPDPVLPTDVQAQIAAKYSAQGLELAKLQGAKTEEEYAAFAAEALKSNEKQIDVDRIAYATERSERMERVVDDILEEGEFTVNIIRQYVANLTKLGTAVIVGPCEEPVVQLALRGEKDTVVYKPEITTAIRFFVPNTMDVYPSPGMTEAKDADLCIRVRYTKEALARAAEMKASGGWRPDVIREILEKYKGIDIGPQTMTDRIEKTAQLGEIPGTTRKYEGIRWFGLASGEELRELGINSDGIGDINPKSYYEAEAIVMANRVIYARVCDPAVGRPVVKTTFYGDATQFFGWPPAMQIDNCQTLMNLAMAAIKKQLQLAGLVPLLVNDYSSFVDADRPGAFALSPGKVFLRNNNSFSQGGAQGPAIQPIQLPNIIREIIALFDAIARLADDASGFNRNMLGSGNFAGAARTATGLMQIQEAASIIATFVIGNIDATGIVPMLTKVIAWINRNHPDKRVKGDPQIIARGQLSKVMKSAQQQVVTAGFQAMQAPIIAQILGADKLMIGLRECLKATDFPNADKIIPDQARLEFMQSMMDAKQAFETMTAANAGQQGQPGQQGAQPAQGGAQQPQAQPQQAQKQAGLGMPSGVEARRGAA